MARRKKDWVKLIGIGVFLAVAVVSFLYGMFGWPFDQDSVSGAVGEPKASVHFIDCGQGDSTLILSEGKVALVDASTREDGEKVVAYLQKLGLEKIDHFILTHPHEDHIGGAEDVLDAFEVGEIHMGRPTSGTEPTTSVYINLLKKIKAQGKNVTATEVGDTFEVGNVQAKVIGPVEAYKDLNDQSIILRLEYDEISFLLTGDQEIPAEKGLLEHSNINELSATVLKVGHHGSDGSTGEEFLAKVSPQYGVISCGADNSYGHPHEELIDRLERYDVEYLRTDLEGTVVMTTDGKGLSVESEK